MAMADFAFTDQATNQTRPRDARTLQIQANKAGQQPIDRSIDWVKQCMKPEICCRKQRYRPIHVVLATVRGRRGCFAFRAGPPLLVRT